jgi:MFS family permease
MVTVFVVHHGAADKSLAVAPQVPKSIYYGVAWLADRLFGVKEAGYRIPSLLLSLAALWFLGRIAARLIHPHAAWFAAFACFGLKALNWEAADARPYAMGLCAISAATLVLIRWLDSARAADAAAFAILASLIWRIQLIFWPAYLIFAVYALARLWRGETRVGWFYAASVFAVLAILLMPVAGEAVALNRQARAHVIVGEPKPGQLLNAVQWRMLVECASAAWLFGRFGAAKTERSRPGGSALLLAAAWWLIPPLALYLFSQYTGNSVFVRRYYSIALPGTALLVTMIAAYFVPKRRWKHAAALLAAVVLAWYGVHPERWPGSDWRAAAAAVNTLPAGTPVITPSPFIEGMWPVWRPDYPLPGFLYAHLSVYALHQPALLFPFRASVESEDYAEKLIPTLLTARRFAIYGGAQNVRFWQNWYLAHPQFSQWSARNLGDFGDVEAVLIRALGREAGGDPSLPVQPDPLAAPDHRVSE